jgi:hypothetical protein
VRSEDSRRRLTAWAVPPEGERHKAKRHAVAYKLLAAISLTALILVSSRLLISLFEPPLPYRILDPGNEPLDSQEFLDVLSATTRGWISNGNAIEVLTNGDQFYAADLAAIKGAQRFIHIECYLHFPEGARERPDTPRAGRKGARRGYRADGARCGRQRGLSGQALYSVTPGRRQSGMVPPGALVFMAARE